MRPKTYFLRFLSLLAALGTAGALQAQMVSSGLTGTLLASGLPIAGAAISAVHTPTNTTFTGVTGPNGRFTLRGLPVGGPYTVSATASGYTVQSLTGIETALGEDREIALLARADSVVVMERFTTTASRTDLDANSTGAGTVLDVRRIEAQPSVNRSFTDLMKTNPFLSVRAFPQVQALGMNNRYNSITLDGARINDQFGLSNSGLFSLFNPFSLDAVEQFSVSLTPYDVRQSGFAGASINAVSKSGTNRFRGSAYFLHTDQDWQGKDLVGVNAGRRTPLKQRTEGYTLGGPILKDRLFFFLNYETFKSESTAADPGYTPDPAFLATIAAQIQTLPGAPDLGTWGGAGVQSESDTKRLAKLDWNITRDHRLTVRYSDTVGVRPITSSFNPGTAYSSGPAILPGMPSTSFPNRITSLSSTYYTFNITEEIWATQLFSNWTPSFKTQVSYSKNDSISQRIVPVTFPEIRIFNVPGTSTTGAPISTGNAFTFGTEVSSQGNSITVNTESYSASGDYSTGNFTLSGGFDREEVDFANLFRNGSYGVFGFIYSPTLNIATATPAGFMRNLIQDGFPLSEGATLEQTGFFGQVKWDPTTRFSLIFGLRYDTIGIPVPPPENAAFRTAFGITNAGTPDGTEAWAPRLSFNYAFDESRTMQARGGLGVFLGRNPLVWFSNSYGSSGVGRSITLSNATNPAPTLTSYLTTQFDPNNPIGTTPNPGGSSIINLVQPGIKLPTILRGNLALDYKLKGLGATFTVELIHTKQLEALFTDNMNLRPTTVGADGRQRFAGNAAAAPRIAGFGNVLRMRNVRAGASTYGAITFDRPFRDGWAYSATYTRGHATDAQPSGSFTAASNWSFNNVFNRDAVEVARSDYEVRDKLQLSLSREFTFFRSFRSTVSLYYEGRTGQPYSYVYSGDINGDGAASSDLVAVPTGPADPRFDFSGLSAAQQAAYFAFIRSSGLEKFAGSYAERNAFTGPWQNRLDLRFSQEIPTYGPVKLELFADFINFGSWLSRDLFNYIETLDTAPTNSNQLRQFGNATYNAAGQVRPTVALDAAGAVAVPSSSSFRINNGDSRWRVQFGARLKF